MKYPTVLHLINGKRILGAEQVAVHITRSLPELGYSPLIGLVNGDDTMLRDLKTLLGNQRCDIFQLSSGYGFWTPIIRLLKLFYTIDINIIHSHGYKSDIISLLSLLFRPRIFLVATNHNYTINSRREKIYRLLDIFALSVFDRIVAVSDSTKQEMIEAGISQDRITVIDNGITIPDTVDRQSISTFRKATGVRRGEILAGIVASLTPEKAHTDLLEAFARLPLQTWRLAIIGDGPLRGQIENKVHHLGLTQRVFFTGHLSNANKIFPALDVFILSSRREGLPIALLEAMGNGIPTIAPAIGSIPVVIEHNVNGLLFRPGDIIGLTEALTTMLDSAEMRFRLAKAGRSTIIERFSALHMTNQYAQLYEQWINNK